MKVLFKTIVGSNLYGLNTPTSDVDFRGFGFPDVDEMIGLRKCEQEENKNLDEEGTIYALTKYFHLLIKGNPTILEVAFADRKFHQVSTVEGREICEFVKAHFLTKHLFKPFNAYFLAMQRDINKLKTSGDRLELIKKFGYDTKAASHCVRLGYQCYDIMKQGHFNPTLQGQQQENCFAIKQGKWTLSAVNSLIEIINHDMYEAYVDSNLPKAPDFSLVNQFLVDKCFKYLQDSRDIGTYHE